LQIYNVKRHWKLLQKSDGNNTVSIHRLFKNYNIALSFAGDGWAHGNLIGLGSIEEFSGFVEQKDDYIFGHVGYDFKSKTSPVENHYLAQDGFNDCHFFVPRLILESRNEEWWIGYFEEEDYAEFIRLFNPDMHNASNGTIELNAVTNWKTYQQNCDSLLRHIHRGDIYEINYCLDFVGESNSIDPVSVFERLNEIADAPMSVLYKNGGSWLICASPERYISRSANTVISQPIKGTIRRGATEAEDVLLQKKLQSDPKECSENVMIVDLVRNDLSRIAEKGSVQVTELFGTYPFKTVHQLISTVRCEVDASTSFEEIINATFPMGSMTGAPKINAMKLAEHYEEMSRGIYSGSVGCILPNGDFDFNVVIRSITWNSATGLVSAKAGGAITANSVPEKEYEECLLKARAMMHALNPNPTSV